MNNQVEKDIQRANELIVQLVDNERDSDKYLTLAAQLNLGDPVDTRLNEYELALVCEGLRAERSDLLRRIGERVVSAMRHGAPGIKFTVPDNMVYPGFRKNGTQSQKETE